MGVGLYFRFPERILSITPEGFMFSMKLHPNAPSFLKKDFQIKKTVPAHA